jgi:hypothetical protein
LENSIQSLPQSEFAKTLQALGFSQVLEEFPCFGSEHPFVDVVAKVGSYYWGFEYKSERDSVYKGFEQISCYSDWFDFVVLVSERLLGHKNYLRFDSLTSRGYGIWFFAKPNRIITIANPRIQRPNERKRKYVKSLMQRLSKYEQLLHHKNVEASLNLRQTTLFDFPFEEANTLKTLVSMK